MVLVAVVPVEAVLVEVLVLVEVGPAEVVRATESMEEVRRMKVAVTSLGPDMTSDVDPRFGRARWFVIVDTETGESEAIDNESGVDASSGAGVQAAARVAGLGVEYVLTGHCGPNAFRTLTEAGVEVVTLAKGTVEEAVGKLQGGELSPVDAADVNGHWS